MGSARDEIFRIFRDDVLPHVADVPVVEAKPEVCGFLPMEGNVYPAERALMVVGRAANGWSTPVELVDLAREAGRREFAEGVERSVVGAPDRRCPMLWVTDRWQAPTGYRTVKSAFWRVTRRVTGELGIADIGSCTWPSHLVWSNLYKVSPKAGNPGTRLANAQLDGCRRLLQAELGAFRPNRILFLTGLDWAEPFLNTSGNSDWSLQIVPSVNQGRVHTAGLLQCSNGAVPCVIACHPERKSDQQTVDDVVAAFRQIEREAPFMSRSS